MIRAHLYVPEVNADLGREEQKVIMDKTKQTALVIQRPIDSNYFLISSGDQYYLKCSESGAVSWSKRSAALDPYLSTNGFLWRYDESRQALLTETGRNLLVNKKTLAVSTNLVSSSIVQLLPESSITSTELKTAETVNAQTTSSPQDAWWLWLILILIIVLLLLLVMFMLVGWGNGYRWMKKP